MNNAISWLAVIVFALIMVWMIRIIFRGMNSVCDSDYEDETVVTTTTVTHETPNYIVRGNLTKQFDNNQPFVLDPADGAKIWVNSHDDMYEDAAGAVWRLV